MVNIMELIRQRKDAIKRKHNYDRAAKEEIKRKADAEYYRALEEKERERARLRAQKPTIGERFKEGIKQRVAAAQKRRVVNVKNPKTKAPPNQFEPSTSDRTREIFGGNKGKNPFYD